MVTAFRTTLSGTTTTPSCPWTGCDSGACCVTLCSMSPTKKSRRTKWCWHPAAPTSTQCLPVSSVHTHTLHAFALSLKSMKPSMLHASNCASLLLFFSEIDNTTTCVCSECHLIHSASALHVSVCLCVCLCLCVGRWVRAVSSDRWEACVRGGEFVAVYCPPFCEGTMCLQTFSCLALSLSCKASSCLTKSLMGPFEQNLQIFHDHPNGKIAAPLQILGLTVFKSSLMLPYTWTNDPSHLYTGYEWNTGIWWILGIGQ